MSTEQIWQIESTSLKATGELATLLGNKLQGGEVIELVSDLGGGKTTFVKSLAKGLGSTDQVSSPTFTLSNIYRTGNLSLHHFDFYRLSEPGIMREELAEVLADPKAVIVIEWADIVKDVLPAQHMTIHITSTGESSRSFSFTYPQALAYLIPQSAIHEKSHPSRKSSEPY